MMIFCIYRVGSRRAASTTPNVCLFIANPRFCIYDHNGDSDPFAESTLTDDLVLDKETGLIWTRHANLPNSPKSWEDTLWWVGRLILGNRIGWRAPTIEELSTLIDPSMSEPALPDGHPFIGIELADPPNNYYGYWSQTTYAKDGVFALFIIMNKGEVNVHPKSNVNYLWPVRGGNGYATHNWW